METLYYLWNFSINLKLFQKIENYFLLFQKIHDKIFNFSSHNNSGNVYRISRNNSAPLVFQVSAYFAIHAE